MLPDHLLVDIHEYIFTTKHLRLIYEYEDKVVLDRYHGLLYRLHGNTNLLLMNIIWSNFQNHEDSYILRFDSTKNNEEIPLPANYFHAKLYLGDYNS